MTDDEHLMNIVQKLERVSNWVLFIGSVWTLIAWVIVLALMIKRKQLMRLTNSIKVSFILFLIQLILNIVRVVRIEMAIPEN